MSLRSSGESVMISSRWKRRTQATLMALGLIGLTPLAQGGILDILRGEPQVEWQRVAFVGTAKVKQVAGPVERLAGIDEWQPLEEGVLLQPGDMIRSQPGGTAVLKMEESGSLVKASSATILRLIALETEWDQAALTGEELSEGYCVRSLRGEAFFRNEDSSWLPVEVNTVLPKHTLVRTEPGASLDLYDTREQRFVRIGGNTQTELSPVLTLARKFPAPVLAATGPVLGR